MSQEIIRNRIFTIYGPPGAGKSFFATFLASFHKRIYANYEIKYKGRDVTNRIKNINDLEGIEFSEIKGVVVIDEGGINLNARRSQSEGNMEFGKLAMLGRKKNVNIIVISQLERMPDVYIRELSASSFLMHSWFVSNDKLMFEYDLKDSEGNTIGTKFADLFEWSKMCHYEYDTLESGKIDMNTEKAQKRKQKQNQGISSLSDFIIP